MVKISGELSSLKGSFKKSLNRFEAYKTGNNEIIGTELYESLCSLSNELGVQVAVLVDREGVVLNLIIGARKRLYLPDLGRYRLSKTRLRKLRLFVFAPLDALDKVWIRNAKVFGKQASLSGSNGFSVQEAEGIFPYVPDDFISDLEKLRFDFLAFFPVDSNLAFNKESKKAVLISLEPDYVPEFKTSERKISFEYILNHFEHSFNFKDFVIDLEKRLGKQVEDFSSGNKEGVVLVGVYDKSQKNDSQASIDELSELVSSAGLKVAERVIQFRRELDPRTIVGKGRLEEIVLLCLDLGVDLIIFDCELSAGQLRSITSLTELRVLDRSMLILDIFAQRAKSSEGKLQVELAQLKYSLPRLTDKDSGLSRLTGGIGGRGPGETKLEISRRRARDRIVNLERQIDKMASQRALRRQRRQNRGVPVVSLIGYTNAGKSSLLNSLTKSDVVAEDKMFATLDPSSRRMRFPDERELLFIDTVGFIRNLPEELKAAFKVTLEEIHESDLLIHVVDASDHNYKNQIKVVEQTLFELGLEDKNKILVLNKIDLLNTLELSSIKSVFENMKNSILVSSRTRENLPLLIQKIQDILIWEFKGRDPGGFLEIKSF